MKIKFFPRDFTFWIYHCCALFIVISVDLITSMSNSQINHNILKVSCLFMGLFTLFALVFRYTFNTFSWYQIEYRKQIPSLLFIGTLLSILITSVIIITCYFVPYFNPIYQAYIGKGTQLLSAFSTAFMLKQSLQTQLFMCSWIFIYTSITHQRHALSAKMKSLELANSLKSAQLENLNTQLNPHFLFNSLNNIRFMIAESVDMADDMMVNLSELLRYALEISQSNKVSLNDELAMLNKYMQLIKVQYEDKLNFINEVPNNSHNLMIPPMMLQLLVENAVKYGVESSTTAGTIKLTSSQTDNTLTLSLANTLPTKNDVSVSSMQIGIANIRDRLHLLYGNKASFNTQVKDNLFIATLELPKESRC